MNIININHQNAIITNLSYIYLQWLCL